MAAFSYMQRRTSGIYEFRKRLPQEIAGKPAPAQARAALPDLVNPATGCFKRELVVSLRTTDFAKAKRLDLREAVRVTDLLALAVKVMRGEEAVEAGGFGRPTAAEIEADTVAALLAEDEEEREQGDARRHMQTPQERAQWPDLTSAGFGTKGMAEGHLEVLAHEIDLLSEDFRRALAERRPEIIRLELNAYLRQRGVPIDPSSPFYREAGLAMLKGHVKAYDLMQRRQQGDDIPTPPPGAVKGPRLSEAHVFWREGSPARGGKQSSPRTIPEAERAVRYFTQWHGDLRLGEITKEKAREFRNAIGRMPVRLSVKHRAMPLRTLLESKLSGLEPIHAATVNKYLNLLSAIVSAAEREGRLDKLHGFTNPFRGLSLTIDKRSEEGRRKAFTESHLKSIFRTGVYASGERPKAGGGEAAFWLPLISLLSGARQNEIAQLRLVDIRQEPESGIWFIDIGTDGGRAIKTVGSRRQVPLHPELVRLGLLRYRQSLIDAAGKGTLEANLWPGIKSADTFYRSAAWSKWFNRYLRDAAGITDRSLVFHSFRHSFKRLARDAGLSEETHDALTGHAGNGGVGRSYGGGFGLKTLADAMRSIEAPSPVKALSEWKAPAERASYRASSRMLRARSRG